MLRSFLIYLSSISISIPKKSIIIIGIFNIIYIYYNLLIIKFIILMIIIAYYLFIKRIIRAFKETVIAHLIQIDIIVIITLISRIAIFRITFINICLIPYKNNSILIYLSN